MRRVAAVIGACLLVLGACSGDEGYPPEAVESFMESCTTRLDGSRSYWRCAIDNLQESMSFDDFQAAQEELTSGSDNLPQEMRDAAEACVDEL
jgi:hypothetical protein